MLNRPLARVLALCLALLPLACNTAPERTDTADPNADFDTFKEHFVETLWELDPTWASYVGRREYDSLLTLPTEAQRTREATAYAALRDSLGTFDPAALSVLNRMDLKMLRDFLTAQRWYRETLKAHTWNPAAYNVGGACARVLQGRYGTLPGRLRSLSNRLALVPTYYAAARENLETTTLPHLQLALVQSRGVLDGVLNQAMRDSVARADLPRAEKRRFNERLDSARAAVAAYVAYLEDVQQALDTASARDFRLGPEAFRRKFDLDLQSGFTADEVFARAKARKRYLHRHMDSITTQLWAKYVPDEAPPADSLQKIRRVIDAIAESHTTRGAFVTTIREQIPELTAFVDSADLLTQDPTKPLVVRETPLYMRGGGAGASVSAPGPYDQDGETFYNVTPLDGYDEAGAESYLREYNDYTLQILNVHEAIPGHYTQLVYANKAPSVVKSVLGNGAMIEGWAVYAELMMLEAGYRNSPEMWLMYDKWNLRVTTNAILDHLVHTTNLSEAEAMQLLVAEAFQERSEAEGKWRRAKLSQVQLSSYFTGFTEILALREALKKQQGDAFDLKAFHEQFLSYGSAPVPYIAEAMRE
ncbi:MAG: DUF885 domain-containing protein [Catalinimonas sp.]